jgi:hypothetical protein
VPPSLVWNASGSEGSSDGADEDSMNCDEEEEDEEFVKTRLVSSLLYTAFRRVDTRHVVVQAYHGEYQT